ncbi:TPA: hypothetical protein ACQFKW_003099 [Proteus mirabilis]|uniref:hypothetical protein n=1 Tax=Proteus mirabilis TaxID=584 RepID=UPI0007AB4D65|nr:hypothetical protein [Proteus mirabilis]ELB0940438.1 hypothetical protein [Proteus mirabilis]KZE58299.1 hypothetical protein AV652_15175 [Proteus mirabilis]MBG2743234.1 hypothetical protein [Proteus mirabilis]MBG5957654.1 hypothetical protein [Proteus mirabilis]MBI6235706.1 hypothetical protein [Proteus mirabilis]
MGYEATELLLKCDADDYAMLISQIDSYVNFSSDKELKKLLIRYRGDPSPSNKVDLAKAVEREIRYIGSADIAYMFRKISKKEDPAGVSMREIIDDVSIKLKVKQKQLGGIEARLERLVKLVAEKSFLSMSSEQQRKLFEESDIGSEQQNEFFNKLKDNNLALLPLLMSVLGPEITAKLVQGLAVLTISQFIGKEAAKKLIEQLATKFPWWSNWLGPIVWSLSLSWLVFDLQGAANRKTIPIMLYLGLVGLRDGPEDGDEFWSEE